MEIYPVREVLTLQCNLYKEDTIEVKQHIISDGLILELYGEKTFKGDMLLSKEDALRLAKGIFNKYNGGKLK
ncbi:hypothetical protein PSYJYH_000031 [Bacillus phage PSYJ-YH]|nr:hypothetical protein PSYJYH_000031 [Bacillus phage PSYJ-YH]